MALRGPRWQLLQGQERTANHTQQPCRSLLRSDSSFWMPILATISTYAFALALLLRGPEVKILGITTAFGDTELHARLVDRYLAAAGRSQIPVEAGVATPVANHFTQAAYARQAPVQKHGDAVGFMLREIRAHPGEITLVSISPLFNLHAAITRDPATFCKLKQVVMMGGSVYRGYDVEKIGDDRQPPSPEWNIVCDPAGARAPLASGVPVFMMPLDSTRINLTLPELGTILSQGSPLTDQLTFALPPVDQG